MSDLVAFIRARLDEDEQAARKAARFKYDRPTDAPWEKARLALGNSFELSSSAHIARHDPARVLREVEAKRRIVDEHANEGGYCRICTIEDRQENTLEGIRDDGPYMVTVQRPLLYPCPTLRLLALPYADCPDYRQEWKP
jgi:hypothetical protein